MDLQEVEYISSGGIRMMLAIEKFLAKQGGKLKASHVKDNIREVFDMVGFTNAVEIVRNERDAGKGMKDG